MRFLLSARSYFVAGAAAVASDVHNSALRIPQFSVTSNTWNPRNAGRVLTYEHLLRRIWRLEVDTDPHPMRSASATECPRGRRWNGRGAPLTGLRFGNEQPPGNVPTVQA